MEDLQPGEGVVKEGAANHLAWLSRGGRLYLTDRRIAFRPHRLEKAFGAKPVDIALGSISDVEKCSSKIRLRWLLVLPTQLAGLRAHLLVRVDRHEHEFLVWGLNDWMEALATATNR